jgi:hypothetical protein
LGLYKICVSCVYIYKYSTLYLFLRTYAWIKVNETLLVNKLHHKIVKSNLFMVRFKTCSSEINTKDREIQSLIFFFLHSTKNYLYAFLIILFIFFLLGIYKWYYFQKTLCHAQIIVALFLHFSYSYAFMPETIDLFSFLRIIPWPNASLCIIALTMIKGVINLNSFSLIKIYHINFLFFIGSYGIKSYDVYFLYY